MRETMKLKLPIEMMHLLRKNNITQRWSFSVKHNPLASLASYLIHTEHLL